jgi:hypothetical protein
VTRSGPGRRGQPDQVGAEGRGLDAELRAEPAEANPRLDRDVAELGAERRHPDFGEAGEPYHLRVRVGGDAIGDLAPSARCRRSAGARSGGLTARADPRAAPDFLSLAPAPGIG